MAERERRVRSSRERGDRPVTNHTYPTRALAGDYALASVGAAFMLGPLALPVEIPGG